MMSLKEIRRRMQNRSWWDKEMYEHMENELRDVDTRTAEEIHEDLGDEEFHRQQDEGEI